VVVDALLRATVVAPSREASREWRPGEGRARGGERGRAGVAAAGEGNGGERRTFSVWRRGVGGRLRVHDVPQLLPPTSGPIAPWDPTFSLVDGGTRGVAARGRERPALARAHLPAATCRLAEASGSPGNAGVRASQDNL
jgi:hypothetical protein